MPAAQGFLSPCVLLFFLTSSAWADLAGPALPNTPEVAAYWWAVGACTLAAGLGGILKCIEFFRDKRQYAEKCHSHVELAEKVHTHPELHGLENKVLLKLECMRNEFLLSVNTQFQRMSENTLRKIEEVDQKNEERASSIHTRVNAQVEAVSAAKARLEDHLSSHKKGNG